MPERGTMKPIIELTAAEVGKQVRVTDQHLSIEGTLSSVRFWTEVENVEQWFGRTMRTITSLFIEIEIAGIDGKTQLTTAAEFEVIE